METLDDLRRRIDAIDSDILKKLEERTKIVEEVGHRKAKSGNGKSFMRPGREATMVRRLMQDIEGSFPKAAIAAIWRVIIASSLGIEQPMRIAAYRTAGEEECYWLAREYFGTFTPIEPHTEVLDVLGSVERGEAAAAVLPMPWHDADDNRWWTNILDSHLKVFAHIPFVQNEESDMIVKAVAVANVQPEPTGDDTTLLCLHLPTNATDKQATLAMQKASLEVTKLCSTMGPEGVILLVYLRGFYMEEDEAIRSLAIGKPRIIGAYANPITL